METLFVRILEKTLLILGLLCLILTLGGLVYAAAGIYPSLLPRPKPSDVEVQYQPLNSGPVSTQPTSPTSSGANDNPDEGRAIRACSAENDFIKKLTDGNMGLHSMDECGRVAVAQALATAPDRTENYLDAEAAWFDALAADPALKSTIPHGTSDNVSEAVDAQEARFAKAFSDRVEKDDRRLEDFAMRQDFGKVAAAAAGIFAASCFVVFLFIAFLIVAVRVERHLRTIATIAGKASAGITAANA